MRTRWTIVFASAVLLASNVAPAQQTAPAAATGTAANPAADSVNEQSSRLEAGLAKVKDASPEAAELMIQLVDLYHQHGRVFGLVRVAQQFVNLHSTHPRHKDVMLKLIDGLVVTARNKETTAMCRQFLERYPDHPDCSRLEVVLAEALDQIPDLPGAAAAHEAVWKRQGASPQGRDSAIRALQIAVALNNKDSFIRAATLGEDMLDKLPPGEFAAEAGADAMLNWYRAGDYARSNAAANKLLAKGCPIDPKRLTELHSMMAQSYANLGQRTNAVDSLRKARALIDSPELHGRMIAELHYAQATPAEMEPVVNEYLQKYPTRPDRFAMRSFLGHALLRATDNARALGIFAELLGDDAVSNDSAGALVRTNGADPAKLAETERVLQAAVAKNPTQAYYLRYYLGLSVYRDMFKDLAKARQTIRELVTQSPSNDGYTSGAMSWLLYNEPNDQEFQADVQQLLKVRADRIYWAGHRGMLPAWCKEASANAEHKARAAWAQAQVDAQDQDPLFKDWIAGESPDMLTARAARARLLVPNREAALNIEQARTLFQSQGYSYRYYGPAEDRAVAVDIYARMAARFPQDFQAAITQLEVTFDFGTPAAAKAAAAHLLNFAPPMNVPDAWRRILGAADRAQDPAMIRQGYAWLQQSQDKYGPDPTYASGIGDLLEKYEMKAEAAAYWRRAVGLNRDYYESRACAERIATRLQGAERTAWIQELLKTPSDFHGAYAMWLAADFLKAADLANFEKTLRDSRARQDERPLRNWGMEEYPPQTWVDQFRADMKATEADKRRVFTVVRDLRLGRPSAAAILALQELPPEAPVAPMQRLLALAHVTTVVGDSYPDWDRLLVYGQAAMARKDYESAAVLVTGMLANIPAIDEGRKQAGREMVGQSYARMGAAGFSIDENSPIAPLLQAALYLRLGDERLALESYNANRALFDEHRNEMPIDLLRFVCESHIAAGGDENHERAEDILRGWLVKNSEAKEIDDDTKAGIQLLLAKNYFKAQRFDIARGEYTTVMNRWPNTPEAIEADFGIGESYMAQKVYDQAEAVFEKLSGGHDRDVVIRADFLRGVLANRRGDRDEAREIFRAVLDRVPSVELANQALFNLAEVYGAEQRYMDQLELLRTIGRLGRSSQRWHAPGTVLSIVVQDSDLGVSRGHGKIPVKVTTEPGGDVEVVYLYSGGAGKGLFRADLETRLGQAEPNNKVLELTGKDTIKCDYPPEFKAEFRSAPPSNAEIRIAANAKFEVSSSKIIDEDKETFSERLEREARAREQRHVAETRPKSQVKPGNLLYMRVQDGDRDLSDAPDEVMVKLVASGGDEVQVKLAENGPHTGVFEGTAPTGELPAGALASDTSIGHNPLMAIDRDLTTAWLSKPDGATPKWISIDMKALKRVDHVTISTPSSARHAPVRGKIEGTNDGRFWFRIASQPPFKPVDPVEGEAKHMSRRVYAGNYTGYTDWNQIVALTKNTKPIEATDVDQLSWKLPGDVETAKQPYAVLWHGKLVQPRAGAARIAIRGITSALVLDGILELPVGPGNRQADVWLEPGTHDVTIFATMNTGAEGAEVTWAREDHSSPLVVLGPFRNSDFDLEQAVAKPAEARKPAVVKAAESIWDFSFEPRELRQVRFVIDEFLGEAVAVNQFIVRSDAENEQFIPTSADVLSLAANDILEIAGGDVITATYTDELTQTGSGQGQLLSNELTATYFDGAVNSISYDFVRQPSGQVVPIRKQLIRIDPGERLVVEVVDYDQDQTDQPDLIKIEVAVNDGKPLELTAQETLPYSGVFTKEVDTSVMPEEGKLTVKAGDRITCRYRDAQNTFPGHAVPRETIVFVTEPSRARIRIVETRVIRAPPPSKEPPRFVYLPVGDKPRAEDVAHVAFEVPLTVEVFDSDSAKDSGSKLTVKLTTTDGATIDVDCVVSSELAETPDNSLYMGYPMRWALEEGRFVGQVILQLGSKHSPKVVPLSAGMPRNLIGRAKIDSKEDGKAPTGGEPLISGVLNLSGKDLITAAYDDTSRPSEKAKKLAAKARLIANATLACTDRDYEKDVSQLHVGEKMYVVVTDADLDVSDERDRAGVEVTTQQGDKETIALEETLAHSGVFTGSVHLKPAEKAMPGNLTAENPTVETYFGDSLHLHFLDKAASTETGELQLDLELPVVVGTDGLVAAFSKSFDNEELAVETQFHVAESYFELFKSHKKLGRNDEQRGDLEAGRRVLREVMEDYPNPKYVPRIAYLLGQFAQELQHWNEAIESYQMIVRQHGDHPLAPDAQYKLAQCHEEAGDFDQALEAYVTLAATYPKSPLIANVMIRISERFYRTENYQVAAQVGDKFLERFESHEWAPKMAFRVGQCYYKAKKYPEAGKSFDQFAKIFPDDALCADALFWSGESFRMAGNIPQAFRRYNRCRWDYPSSEPAKYSRGRLALPEMLQQFEAEANVDDE